ncbi:MAG: acyltransferase [Bdellovibrionaceae bacterium]|nr:acyltransferase [Pseudobdellovibrionaceae bacterium]
MSSSPPVPSYRPDIDGLRAVSIIAVVAYHAELTAFQGGFVGVDVFFVISGYLITGLLLKEHLGEGGLKLAGFYSKRFRRLLPAMLFCVAGVTLLWMLVARGVPEDTIRFAQSIPPALFGLANLHFKNRIGGYFDGQAAEIPLLHFWSLAVEEQFYLFWPPIILLLGLWARRRQRAFQREGFLRLVERALITICLLSFALAVFWVADESQRQEAFYLMPSRTWELGVGALLALRGLNKSLPPRRTPSWRVQGLALLGFLAILIPVFAYDHHTPFPGLAAAPPALGAALLIWIGGNRPDNGASRLLAAPFFVQLGLLSYGWYLWHWPLLAISKVLMLGETPPLWARLAGVTASLALAWISLRWIEPRYRHPGADALAPRQVVIRSLLTLLGVSVLAQSLPWIEKNLESPSFLRLAERADSRTDLFKPCHTVYENIGSHPCVLDPDSRVVKKPLIGLWGDSHAYAHFPLLESFSARSGTKSVLYSGSSTPGLLPSPDFFLISEKHTEDLRKYNEKVFADIARKVKDNAPEPVSIILISRWTAYTGKRPLSVIDETLFLDRRKTREGSLKVLRDSLEATLTELQKTGVHRILIGLPFPEYRYRVLRCARRGYVDCSLPREIFENHRQETVRALRETGERFPNVRFFDPVPLVCPTDSCPQTFADATGEIIPVVFDDDHPSVMMARKMGLQSEELLRWLIDETNVK